ncbi:carboxypeptidase-like regulatory domain-containing protein [Telmatobacter sp. DSM 110680]|uniref:Carboxypeptidase-like regulatory domain-containing protein n=1 Tax=Telmatobacter sp. DSM 110680 TaxID=3036704 RepID=A0AAU7DQR7_9BACT
MKGNRARLSTWAVFITLAAGIVPAVHPTGEAYAQNLGQRNVAGLVLDANSAPVQGATVFLKNQKTKSIRSYTSATNGSFRFAQVNMTDDYDLWAEKEGKKSPTKTVSSWDARKEFSTELKFK